MCVHQWRRTQILHSIPQAFCLPHFPTGFPCWATLSGLGHLPTQKTLHNYLASYYGYSRLQQCLYEDKFTTSQQRVPSHIQVHLPDFWNYCLWATFSNDHLSLLVVHNQFMHNPNCRNIASLVPTNLQVSLSNS